MSIPGIYSRGYNFIFLNKVQFIEPFVAKGADLEAILKAPLFENPNSSVMAPGSKTASVALTLSYANLYTVSSPPSKPLIITQEDVYLDYSGLEYFSTPSPTSITGSVTLEAYVLDNFDSSKGDVRRANITFTEDTPGGSVLGTANQSVVLVNPSNHHEGTAQTSFNYTLSGTEQNSGGKVFDVLIMADNYYGAQTLQVHPVTLAMPGQDFITGGGHIVMSNSAGTYAASANSKMNFGFNMKWNKSGKNVQGKMNIVFRRFDNGQWKTYQIKSNAISSLIAANVTGGRVANVNTKANLTDVTDPLNPISLGGGLDLTVEAFESTTVSNGSLDMIGVQLKSGSSNNATILFSSHWVGGQQMKLLGGGKIKVRNATVPPKLIDEEELVTEEYKVFPNPSTGTFNLVLPTADKDLSMVITDLNGKTVAMEHIEKNQSTNIRFDLRNISAGVYLLQVNNGDEVYRTKLMVQ